MKKLFINTKDCSCAHLVRVAKRSGFHIFEGNKHCKVVTLDGRFVTTIPRHNRLKRETSKGIVQAFNAYGAEVTFV